MRVLISGGTGFIGGGLTRALAGRDHTLTLLSRHARPPQELDPGVSIIVCDSTMPGDWQERVREHDVIINLAGASIFRRWTPDAKRLIEDSRILTTRNLVAALTGHKNHDIDFFSVSGVGYYGDRGDLAVDESQPAGDDFLAQVALHWEESALVAREIGARVVICRLGHVLGRTGGMLPRLMSLSRLRLGAKWGTGNQWISWIHIDELISSIQFLLERRDIEGPVNITSPNPVRNWEMLALLNRHLHTTAVLPRVPALALSLMLGDFASVFLKGQRVVPRRLLGSGYEFRFPALGEALSDIIEKT